MPTTRRKKTTMSDSHKAALAEGRAQGRAVRNYLEAIAFQHCPQHVADSVVVLR